MIMTEALLVDGIMIMLLAVTIYIAFRLDRRLQSVRSVQHELAGVIRELNAAAARAEAGIQGLKLAAKSSGEELEAQIKSARAAADELAVLMKSAERVARMPERSRTDSSGGGRPSTVTLPPQPHQSKQPQALSQSSALDALRALAGTR
jgi:hypothetical protein